MSDMWLPGAIEGWRVWDYSMCGDLRSLSFATPWPFCRPLVSHIAPSKDNIYCGIHAWHDWQTMRRETTHQAKYAMCLERLYRIPCDVGRPEFWRELE